MSRPGWAILLPCVGMVALGALTASADPEERTGADAPHHERNEAKNEKKTALALSEVEVPFVTSKPVRKATAVAKDDSTSRSKSKDKKKADRVAKEKEKAKPTTTPADTVQERRTYELPDDFVGSDAPRQERNSDPTRHAARLFILER